VKEIAAGVSHACAITSHNKLIVWGVNKQCQLGYPNRLRESHQPIFFGGNLEIKSCRKDFNDLT